MKTKGNHGIAAFKYLKSFHAGKEINMFLVVPEGTGRTRGKQLNGESLLAEYRKKSLLVLELPTTGGKD